VPDIRLIERYVGPRGSYEIYGRTVLIPLRSESDRADAVLRKLRSNRPIPLEGVRRVASVHGIEEKELHAALARAGAAIFTARFLNKAIDMVCVPRLGANAGAR
jgi:hypothetical protein